MVVLTSLWPNNSWTVRISWPLSKRCVAKLCRKVWQLPFFVILALSMASFTALWTADSWKWCRRCTLSSGSKYRVVAGNTYCHRHSLCAFGNLRFKAFGNRTLPKPSARSLSCRVFTRIKWVFRGEIAAPAALSIYPYYLFHFVSLSAGKRNRGLWFWESCIPSAVNQTHTSEQLRASICHEGAA